MDMMFWRRSAVTVISLSYVALAFRGTYHHPSNWIRGRAMSMLSESLKDFVKVDIYFSQKGRRVETPFDDGVVSFVVDGGRYFPEVNSRAMETPVGETTTFTAKIGEYKEELAATVPTENTPGGLRVGDVVKLSNGLKVRVTEVTDDFVKIDANPPLAGEQLDVIMRILERRPHTTLAQATFAAGCFWGLELAFQRVRGVAYTAVGYTHGAKPDPTYEEVCSGLTGHAEAVTVLYDANEVSYEELLEVFWNRHDPTQLNRQGNDVGTQYRSGVYYHSLEQMQTAQASMAEVQKKYTAPLATELVAANKFWMGEAYHQQYLEKGGQSAKKTADEKIRCYG
jgi:peptide-methionine (S)-S-oxide reductase